MAPTLPPRTVQLLLPLQKPLSMFNMKDWPLRVESIPPPPPREPFWMPC
jgi:hypothetical protein